MTGRCVVRTVRGPRITLIKKKKKKSKTSELYDLLWDRSNSKRPRVLAVLTGGISTNLITAPTSVIVYCDPRRARESAAHYLRRAEKSTVTNTAAPTAVLARDRGRPVTADGEASLL